MECIVTNLDRTTTLRHIANEQYADDAIDYFLSKKLGKEVFYIVATELYAIDHNAEVADRMTELSGGFVGFYEGLQQLPIVSTNHFANRLGTVEDEPRSLACFTTIDTECMPSLRHRDMSLGSIAPTVGIDVDQAIELEQTRNVMRASSKYEPYQALRLVQ